MHHVLDYSIQLADKLGRGLDESRLHISRLSFRCANCTRWVIVFGNYSRQNTLSTIEKI